MDIDFLRSAGLLFVLLNPFLLSIYLIDLIQGLDKGTFDRVLLRGAAISAGVFIIFALIGDTIFTKILQARFASFLLFGGVIFLIISVRFVLSGSEALKALRGKPEHVEGSVAMPFMIGPGTVSASILTGTKLSPVMAPVAILLALVLVAVTMIVLKRIHDYVRRRNEPMVERYLDISGRIMALVMGTFAVEMILQGLEGWFSELPRAIEQRDFPSPTT